MFVCRNNVLKWSLKEGMGSKLALWRCSPAASAHKFLPVPLIALCDNVTTFEVTPLSSGIEI